MDDHPVHTQQTNTLHQNGWSPNVFLQIILAAKWLVQHSSTSLNLAATTFAFSYVFILLFGGKWSGFTVDRKRPVLQRMAHGS